MTAAMRTAAQQIRARARLAQEAGKAASRKADKAQGDAARLHQEARDHMTERARLIHIANYLDGLK